MWSQLTVSSSPRTADRPVRENLGNATGIFGFCGKLPRPSLDSGGISECLKIWNQVERNTGSKSRRRKGPFGCVQCDVKHGETICFKQETQMTEQWSLILDKENYEMIWSSTKDEIVSKATSRCLALQYSHRRGSNDTLKERFPLQTSDFQDPRDFSAR